MIYNRHIDEIKLLKRYKEKYGLTWKQVADTLGLKESTVGNWYSGKREIPKPYPTLIRIFLEHPQIFEKYRLKTYL